MITLNKEGASEIVKQLYPSASDPVLSLELDITKGLLRYRPYAVYFKLLLLEYRRLVKADEVTFAYTDNLKHILMMQKALDVGDTIPSGQTVDELLASLNELNCQTCDDAPVVGEQYIGVSLI